jgi:hypothetical protein
MYVPGAQPRMAAPGVYHAELAGDVEEKQSKFDEAKIYYQAPLNLIPKAGGESIRFLWSFQPDSEIWMDALLAIGGRRTASGGVTPPAHPEGRRFEVTLVKAQRKDGKEKREIVSAGPIEGQAHPADDGPPTGEDPDPDIDAGVPF